MKRASSMARSLLRWWPLAYFVVYFAYLFVYPEHDLVHWVSLVAVPLGVMAMGRLVQERAGASRNTDTQDSRRHFVSDLLASTGIHRRGMRRAAKYGLLVGIPLCAANYFTLGSEETARLSSLVSTGQVVIVLPIAFVFVFLTAGLTEELFFRGILQAKLVERLGSKRLGVIAASVCFGLYHLPYSLATSAGRSALSVLDHPAVVVLQATAMGLILGAMFEKCERQLFAPVLAHTLVNLLPAMTLLKFGP
jgi:membrane protease YdiL (CAAX protease family)